MTAPQILFFKELLSTMGEKNKKEIYLWFFHEKFPDIFDVYFRS